MFAKPLSRQSFWQIITFLIVTSMLILLAASLLAASLVSASNIEPQGVSQPPLSTFNFTLAPGQTADPNFFNSGNTDINFSFTIIGATSASASLTVFNAANSNIWSGSAGGGETLWGSSTLTNGNNRFSIVNTGAESVSLTLKLFRVPALQAPTPTYSWMGKAAPAGLNSKIKLNFPTSGLYTFDFSVNAGGRYEFLLGTDKIQRTITANDAVSLFVEAGVHMMTITQDPAGSSLVAWQVDMAYSGDSADALPYSKSNNAIAEEWLPIHLATPAQVNMVITTTGATADQLTVTINNAEPQLNAPQEAIISVIAGETTWTTFDLPAGTSAIHLETNGDVMSYALEMMTLSAVDYAFAGSADAAGQNSKIRLNFDTAGLYDFDFGDNGRYQFQLHTAGSSYIQKTIEDSGSVTYYVPAGAHDLIIEQDSAAAANIDWAVDIHFNAATNDLLPYAKVGGEIGGVGNIFSAEWLPISLGANATVNMAITATGDPEDSFAVEVYKNGSSSPDYTLTQVLGSEAQWTSFDLSTGRNRLKIVADSGNVDPLYYDLTITQIPTTGSLSWHGNSLDAGLNATTQINFPSTGLYHFEIESAVGFANLILDDNMVNQAASIKASPPDLMNGYDIEVTAGVHEVYVVQDNAYANTEWTASVAPTTAGAQFFTFTGTLDSGESVTPLYPGNMEFNLSLAADGNDVALAITDGSGSPVWNGDALDGETVWGTGTLSGTNELQLTNASGSSVDVTLTLYHIPDAGTSWAGYAAATGLNSEIRVNFPADGLYAFDLTAHNGRYQFVLASDFIQKTVETSSSVTYFVPAGLHNLVVAQDSAVNTDWEITIDDVGAAHDALPYTKSGGEIGGAANDFDKEWLPINLSAATAVNIATTLNGASADNVVLNVRDASDAIIEAMTIYGQETTWMTLDLPAGTNRLELVADSNANPVTYEVLVTAIPAAANYHWDGSSLDVGDNSQIRVAFNQSGLYSFTYGVDNGRYQFFVNEEFVQKTAEADGAVVYYVPQGTHDLTIDQDSSSGADWDLMLSGPLAAHDTLPYQKQGGEIGGSGNDFSEEWLPVHVGTDTLVNAVLTIAGADADTVTLEVWDGASLLETVAPVYGTESVWATFTLPADGRIHLTADGNGSPIAYAVEIIDIPSPTFSWAGTSLARTLNSTIQVDLQVGGFYKIQGDYATGFASLLIDPPALNHAPQSDLDMIVELNAGLHSFVTLQGDSFPTSSFLYTITLESAYAPEIISVTPPELFAGKESVITLNGANFLDGAVVKLLGDSDYTLVTTYLSGSVLTAVVPATVDLGLYTVEVTNPDTQSATLVDGLEVVKTSVFLPFITK